MAQQSPDSTEGDSAVLSPSANGFAVSCLHVVLSVLPSTRQTPSELSLRGPQLQRGWQEAAVRVWQRPQQERNHKQCGEPWAYSSQDRAQGGPASPPAAPLSRLLYLAWFKKTSMCPSSTFVLKEMKSYTVCQGRGNNFNESWNYLCFLDLFVVVV